MRRIFAVQPRACRDKRTSRLRDLPACARQRGLKSCAIVERGPPPSRGRDLRRGNGSGPSWPCPWPLWLQGAGPCRRHLWWAPIRPIRLRAPVRWNIAPQLRPTKRSGRSSRSPGKSKTSEWRLHRGSEVANASSARHRIGIAAVGLPNMVARRRHECGRRHR